MRINVSLMTNAMPVSYRMMFVSFIKEAVRLGNQAFYERLYLSELNQPKPYTFSVYLANFKKDRDTFHVDHANITISSSDTIFMVHLLNGLQQMDKHHYHNWELHIGKIHVLKEKTITSTRTLFSTLSPILVENQLKKPLLITDDDFEQELNAIVNRQFTSLYGRGLYQPIKIIGHKLKKQVVQETNSVAKGQKLFFTCQSGQLILEGDVQDLFLLYQDGLALRKSQGFGTLEVVSSYD